MGSDCGIKIPKIDLSNMNSPLLERGTKEWQQLSKKVREACENYGCFEVVYDKMNMELKKQAFSLIKQLFDLPLETKSKNNDPRIYHGYSGPHPIQPCYESFGLGDVTDYDSVKKFAEVLFPDDIHQFCETFSTMMKSVDELHQTIIKLIIDGYNLGEEMETIMPYTSLLRMMKYKVPKPEEKFNANGLFEHTDKTLNTLVLEDGIPALEIETKDGQWIEVTPSPCSFTFVAGDALLAWSNGRIHSINHRVTMKAEIDRYSFAVFLVPSMGIIKPPKELIDENHPPAFNEFDYVDFLKFSNSEEGAAIKSNEHIFLFAGK